MLTGRDLRLSLEMLHESFRNGLTEQSPLAQQPAHIRIPLRLHQLAALAAMKTKEEELRKGYIVPGTPHTLYSTFAILGDAVGVGKTLTVLSHISQMSTQGLQPVRPVQALHPQSTAAFFSLSPTHQENLFDTLIIVPHTIYRQWQDAICQQTTLVPHFCKNQRDLDKDSLLNQLQYSHLTLISNTLLPYFMNALRHREILPRWRRVIYDEPDTMKLQSSCLMPEAIMTWLVTATFDNLLLHEHNLHSLHLRSLPTQLISEFHPDLRDQLQSILMNHPYLHFYKTVSKGFFAPFLHNQHPLRGHLVVRSTGEFLNHSIQLPPLHRSIIRCQTPLTHRLVEHALPVETESMLHAGDISGALQSLGVSTHTPTSLVEAVVAFRQKEVDRLRRLLQFKREEPYANEAQKQEALANLEAKLQTAETKLQDLRQRIEASTKEQCSICFDEASAPCITPCCSKLFCAACILTWMTRSNACPLCRASFEASQLQMLCFSEEERQLAQTSSTRRLPKKLEALQTLLQENPQGRFLVFSRYENPFYNVEAHIAHRFPVGYLQGNKDSIANMLEDFAAGHLRILFLNSRYAAAGIHIPAATHVILLHRMAADEEKQILGRAYRLGRTEPLQFVSLLHERE